MYTKDEINKLHKLINESIERLLIIREEYKDGKYWANATVDTQILAERLILRGVRVTNES